MKYLNKVPKFEGWSCLDKFVSLSLMLMDRPQGAYITLK